MHPGIHARTTPDKPAVVVAETGEQLTYAELDDHAARFEAVLDGMGLVEGDHIAVLAENTARYFEIVWAAYRSGLYVTPINHHLAADEAAHVLNDSGASVVVVSATLADLAAAVVPLTPRVGRRFAFGGAIPDHEPYEDALAAAVVDPDRATRNRGSIMFYSSGTTGRPKGVKRPLAGVPVDDPTVPEPMAILPRHVFGMDAATVYLSPGPLYHAAPLAYGVAVQLLGGTVIVQQRFDAERALAAVQRHRVTHSQWVPTMLIRMLRLPAAVRSAYDLTSMRVAIHAAAPCPVEVKQAVIDWWGPVLWEYYSSSEAVGITVISPQEWLEHPGSVGRPFGGVAMYVCDEAGAELPVGQDGILYFDTGGRTFVYHRDEEKTRAAAHPTQASWISSGDIGHVDGGGYLYLTDRRGAMIISGGVNIYPQEVELCLGAHPAVADVAVFGIPHDEMGEQVTAVVELVEGLGGPEREAELIAWTRSRIAHYKAPRSISFTDRLPRTPTGKLLKRELLPKLRQTVN